jgi:hypothetical protein
MLVIPTSSAPSQTLSVVLASQPCRIDIYQKAPGLFADLYVSDALIVGGALCLNTVLLVRDAYLGFVGDLAFFDMQGRDDPIYAGLGSRWLLFYVEQKDFLQ